jgi:hypothetical protein
LRRRALAGLALACVALAAPARAAAQTLADYDYENLQFRGLGLEAGWVVPTELEATSSYGLRADMGFVGPHVRVVPAIRFWSSRLRRHELERLAEQIVSLCQRQGTTSCPATLNLGEVRRSDLELSTEAHYILNAPSSLLFYGGGGLSLHLLNGRGEFIDKTFVEDLLDTVAPGLNLVVGSHLPLGRLQFFGEARGVLTSDIQFASFSLGGSWTLPSPP